MARFAQYRNASLGSLLLAALTAQGAQAQGVATTAPGGFSYEINGSQKFVYDSNPLRSATNEQEIFGSTTSPELVLRKKTPLSLIESTTRVDANVFDQSEFNSIDLHEDLMLSRSNQRWTANLGAQFDYDTTRTSETSNYGITKAGVQRTNLAARPQIIFKADERNSWLLTASAVDSRYDDNAYTDYRFYSLAPSFEHQFDERNKGILTINSQRYEATSGASSISESIGPSIGWSTQVNPRLTIQANAGALATEKRGTNAGPDTSSVDYVFSGTVLYKGVQDDFAFRASRARQPFGNGTETLLDSFTVNERHRLNPKLDLTAEARYQQADYEAQPGVNLDTEYSVGTGLAYRIVEDVALTADYKYRNEELTNTVGDVNQHIIMVGVSINPSWSRK